MRGLGFKSKMVIYVTLVIILGSGLLGYYAVQKAETQIVSLAQKKLISDLNSGILLMDALYPGEWSEQNGQLYKGTAVMNDNFEWLDNFGKQTGDTATLFLHDTRIATNVVDPAGKRAVGTQISDKVGNIVLKQEQPYTGEAEVVGQINQAAYVPIKNAAGEVIGIWYVGVPNAPYEQAVAEFKQGIILFIVIEVLAAVLVVWLLARRLLRPLVMITRAAEQVAQGSLQVELPQVNSKDEIGRLSAAIRAMMEHLTYLMDDIRKNMYSSASQISASSEQFSHSLEEMSSSYSEVVISNKEMNENAQAGSHMLNESIRTMNNLSELIDQAAVRVNGAVQDSQHTRETARQGKETMEQTIHALENFAQSSMENAKIIGQLAEYSREIQAIAQTISGIAGSTNLLALNASIEAARAGEAGRGFAVVASEVSKLAEQASEGAQSVEDFTAKISTSLSQAIHMLDQGKVHLDNGRTAAQYSEEALEAIWQAVGTTAASIQEVSSIAQQKVVHAKQVTEKLSKLEETMEHTLHASSKVMAVSEAAASELETLAAGSEELDAMSTQLQSAVSKVLS